MYQGSAIVTPEILARHRLHEQHQPDLYGLVASE
jgi:hypothetical protein